MKRKLWCIGLLLLSVLVTGSPAFAGEGPGEAKDALDKMFSEGWMPVAPGVLQRHVGEHRVETFAIGVEGLRWGVKELEARLRFLEGEYEAHPTDDLRRAIQSYRQSIAKLRKDIARAKKDGEDESLADFSEKAGCNVSFSSNATASYLTSSTQGVTANASAIFNNTCGWYATTYAEAYATATKSGGVVDSFSEIDGPKSGYNVSSTATATMAGGPACSSSAYSWSQYSGGNIFLSASEYNSICPTKLTLAAITGPTSVSFTSSTAACVSKTWSTSASGGTTPYSYKWTVGGAQVGTGSSYTRQVCPSHTNFTLTATVTDGTTPTPQSASQNLAVTVTVSSPSPPLPVISGPIRVLFSSSASACVTKTWTSSVTDGVSPYAYQWKIGTTQVGTSSSYSRTVCPSHASFTLTLIVTDANSQTGSDAHSVSVVIDDGSGPGGGPDCGTVYCDQQ
jgi:hypothetical protein